MLFYMNILEGKLVDIKFQFWHEIITICLSSLECKRCDIFLFILKLLKNIRFWWDRIIILRNSEMMDLYIWLSFYEIEGKPRRYLCLIQKSQMVWYILIVRIGGYYDLKNPSCVFFFVFHIVLCMFVFLFEVGSRCIV